MNPIAAAIIERAARVWRAHRARLLDRVALPLLGLGAVLVAWHAGGGADAAVAPPRPPAAPSLAPLARKDSPSSAHGGEAYEVKTRLADALGDARLDVPSLVPARSAFQSYWRKMPCPWAGLQGGAGQLVTTISFRANSDETQWTVITRDGGAWVPDARVWNMNEGSYDQREAIFAPAPATLAFRTTLPPHARLRVAPALAAPMTVATRFEVVVVDAAGASHAISDTALPAGDAHVWHDLDVDLDAWSGEPIELELRTSSEPAAGLPGPPALALWGDPLLVGQGPTRLPYDVLWIVVDALRPDVAAGLHDAAEDAAKLAAPRAPLETLLPVVPGLMPSIDALAARGVHFEHAWSAAAWTRPGTLAMLTGERSSELGIDTTAWVLPSGQAERYYASDPPLLPLLLRKSGAVTGAFVNNFFMSGYAAVGVDMGFERLTDHRYRTRDTAAITSDALAWLDAHGSDRFFLFVNYNSPHEPYDPVPAMLERVESAPATASLDPEVRAYMAEGAKDDAAIGELTAKIEALGLARETLVVVTADHGETLSTAHAELGIGRMPMRFHHAVGNFEETTRIPIVMALPGQLEGGRAVADRVRNVDLAPTVLDVEGLEADPRMSGRSMLPLARKPGAEPEPRVVVSEGRGSRAILWGTWRFVVHQPPPRPDPAGSVDAGAEPVLEDELYDLAVDPGERRNVAHQHPDVIAELRARLTAALANTPAADGPQTGAVEAPAVLRVRFAGAGAAHRVSGSFSVGDGKHAATVTVEPAGIAREVLRVRPADRDRTSLDFAFATAPEAPVGFDVRVDPPGTAIAWTLFLDDAPWPEDRTFAGPFGLRAEASRAGLTGEEARSEVYSPGLPTIDPARDLGVFFTRDRPERWPERGAERGAEQGKPGPAAGSGSPAGAAADAPPSAEAAKEMQRMLEQWGYAHPTTNPMASPRERE
jgi:arylsulfatase A-like enzyme